MSEHLSDLALDALAARDRQHPHLDACETCRARLASFRDLRTRALASPAFDARFAALAHRAPRRSFALPILALAAALLAVIAAPQPVQRERLKGRPFLQLLTERGEAPGKVKPGTRVGLTVGSGGHAYVLVLAQARDGGVEELWPVEGQRSGAIPPGAARLEPPFEVTPGSVHLTAIFSDAPIDADAALAQLRAPHPPTILPGERARAEADLVVEEQP